MINILAEIDITSPASWFGIPENYSLHGDGIDHTIDVVQWFMTALFVGWTIFFLYAIIRFWHKRNPKADYHGVKNHASTHLEIGVIIVEAVLLLGFALPMWSERTDTFDRVMGEDAVRVRAVGFQFNWVFHYAGADGKFGRIDRTQVAYPGDPCIDTLDPNGYDDIVTNSLQIPVGRPAIIQTTSTDVIHNFSIIPMRIQSDAIPGKDIPMWFTPMREMETSVVCGQLCGASHADMVGAMKVISQKEFDAWLAKESAKSKEKSLSEIAAQQVAVN